VGVVGGADWICPVNGAKFTNDWGNARSGGRRHEGTDMLAARGTPIVASVNGVVRFHESGRGGHGFYLAGDDGIEYFGVHLDSYGKSGRVGQGEVIGYVGDTGNARGTFHLHFEIHPSKRSKVNPYATLLAHC
jgi:peptidoglycan LD-endopeptidase LytH